MAVFVVLRCLSVPNIAYYICMSYADFDLTHVKGVVELWIDDNAVCRVLSEVPVRHRRLDDVPLAVLSGNNQMRYVTV